MVLVVYVTTVLHVDLRVGLEGLDHGLQSPVACVRGNEARVQRIHQAGGASAPWYQHSSSRVLWLCNHFLKKREMRTGIVNFFRSVFCVLHLLARRVNRLMDCPSVHCRTISGFRRARANLFMIVNVATSKKFSFVFVPNRRHNLWL